MTSTERPARVEQFLAEATPERQVLITSIDDVIRATAPELKIERQGKFLGYGPFHYRHSSGNEGDTFVVSMMNGASGVSVYIDGEAGRQHLIEANASRLGKVSVGKGCIRVKRPELLDLEVFAELVRTAADQHRVELA